MFVSNSIYIFNISHIIFNNYNYNLQDTQKVKIILYNYINKY